jgi:hypothetical protein
MNTTATLPATLADTAAARLPATYEAAKTAITECERIDECKGWADRAAALASYARQAKDDSLRVMAVRIQARAERRCGELLKQIPRADESTRYGQAGAVPPVTRTSAASEAGLSDRQRKTALRLASIPESQFSQQVEGPSPPTVTRLAEQGIGTRRTCPRVALARGLTEACASLATFARFCERTDPNELGRAVDVQDVEAVRQFVATADQWLDRFVTSIGD